jgi:hypothetical protein
MGESSRSFNFDDFDSQVADALEEYERDKPRHTVSDEQLSLEGIQRILRPGEIGGVPTKPTLTST